MLDPGGAVQAWACAEGGSCPEEDRPDVTGMKRMPHAEWLKGPGDRGRESDQGAVTRPVSEELSPQREALKQERPLWTTIRIMKNF